MATILVFGSHRDVLGYVIRALTAAGYETLQSLARDETLALIESRHIDVLVLGGPTAHQAKDVVVGALKRKHPWAPVILPEDPDDVLVQVERHFTTPQA